MDDMERASAECLHNAERVVEQLELEGTPVPFWARKQLEYAKAVLETYREGGDWKAKLNESIGFQNRYQSEIDAHFQKYPA
ncbi:hypothetical protein [Pseudomonas sp. Irchel s3h17]|uniref:hypothetical protein n=1 Tax=Pseudomonas sp. Irchel s3h17 TaxID=2009182 RepID=UPI000BA33D07|nr:hypothetical protein [Pseudomonas sp. Irchel s3h17]